MSKSGTSVSYTYNEDGLRVQKNVSGTVTSYILHGKNVVELNQGSSNLHFFYGADGSPAMVVYNGAGYGYVKNLQGDIVSIVNSSGTEVVHYTYDAWGKLLSKTGTLATSLGTLNPFRYRGYVYDEETGLYYLRSRYYNPTWGRFVNGDGQLALTGCSIESNIFAYCGNRPIDQFDDNGAEAKHYLKPTPIIGGITTTYENYYTYESFMLKYREVSNDKWWTAPQLPVSLECSGITDVSYTISQKHISSLWQHACSAASWIGSIAGLVSEGGGAYSISKVAVSMGIPLAPEPIEQVADLISQACDAFGKYADMDVTRSQGHDHEVHTLRVRRDGIIKTVHEFHFEICSTGECTPEMWYVTLYGWQAN